MNHQPEKWEEELDDIHSNVRVLLHGALIGSKAKTIGGTIEILLPYIKDFIRQQIEVAKKEEREWILANCSGGGDWRRKIIQRGVTSE